MSIMSLDLVKSFALAAWNLGAHRQLTWVEEFSGKALTASRTTCPETLPFEILQSNTVCCRAWQLKQQTDIWKLMGSIQ